MMVTTAFYRLYVAAEHHGLPNGRGVIGSTRTTRAGPILRWLMWQMPYHTEHHLFPGVPFHKLGALCRELRERPDSKLAGINDVAPGYVAVNLASSSPCSAAGRDPNLPGRGSAGVEGERESRRWTVSSLRS